MIMTKAMTTEKKEKTKKNGPERPPNELIGLKGTSLPVKSAPARGD